MSMTDSTEQTLLLFIENQLVESENGGQLIDSKYYLQLADHYHVQKKFSNEVDILSRFINSHHADRQDFVEIFERIDRVSRLAKLPQKSLRDSNPLIQTENVDINTQEELDEQELELVPITEDEDQITIVSKAVHKPTYNASHQDFIEKTLTVLTVCAVYTGRDDNDEVFQLSLVLFEYNHSSDKKEKIIETFVASRPTKKQIPQKALYNFNLDKKDSKETLFDKEKIISLFHQADFVVSHNDADIERKILSILIPEISTSPWYSSQKDIPWNALGFESRSLSKLCLTLGLKRPKNSFERAMAICKILQKDEPSHTQIYLERLYNAQPMKPFEWTPSLIKQHQRLVGGRLKEFNTAALILAFAAASYYWFIFG